MKNNNEYLAAIDIGTSTTIAMLGRKTEEGKLEIAGIGEALSKGVKRGVVINMEETAGSIKQAVSQAKAAAKIDFTKAYVGIAGQHIKSLINRGTKYIDNPEFEITQKDVDELKANMYKIPIETNEEILHVIPQNYIVDGEPGIENPVGISGKQLDGNYHIVIGQTSAAKNIEKCVKKAGVELIELILEPLAAAQAVLTEDEKEAGVVLVDIGGGTTDIAIYYDNIIRHTAVVPFGGNVVTNDIKEGCAILLRNAEQLKLQFGCALGELADENKIISIPGISGRQSKEISFRNLAYIIQSRIEEIIDAILFEIEKSGMADKISAGIVVTGGGAMLTGLSELLTLQTGYDVRLGEILEILDDDSPEDMRNCMYATCIGLLLKGFENPATVNALAPKTEDTDEENTYEKEKPEPGGFFGSIKNKIFSLVEDKDLK
ncbi:MAG: cell division protein FtsA [Bacteroidota bacterium]|nr:cell division protein FtsA [Bacteroidota bacterium]